MALVDDLLVVGYIGLVAWIAVMAQAPYILFPELGALSLDVIRRPHGTWAKAPGMLVLTPVLTGIAGILIGQHVHGGTTPVLLATAAAMLLIRLLQSPIAPAISAGVLPISLGITSWHYPGSLLVGLALLAGLAIVRRRLVPPPVAADDLIEVAPYHYSWLPGFAVFLVETALLARLTGWRMILFPPLIVIGYEMFAHAEVCPWAVKPLLLPIACTLSAWVGVALAVTFGDAPLAVAASAAFAIVSLRICDLHVPPAVAVGLLPFVIPAADYTFPLSVAIGTLSLTTVFLVWQAWAPPRFLRQ